MKAKLLSLILCAALLLTALAGCSGSKKDPSLSTTASNHEEYSTTESDTQNTTQDDSSRELSDPVYIEPAEAFAGGSGTQEDPYQIASAQQLALIEAKMVAEWSELKNDYAKAHYVLTADIALNDVSNFESWATAAPAYNWLPIGTGDSYDFHGTLDGAGHTISGMYINVNAQEGADEFGLFASLFGTVKDLTIDKSYISVSGASTYVGSIAGSLWYTGTIDSCTSKANFYTYNSTCGGIVGKAENDDSVDKSTETSAASTLSGCSFEGTIAQVQDPGASILGGIAGSSKSNISNCVNSGTITFTCTNADVVGGIAGWASENTISNCENKGALLCTQTGDVPLARIGGIVGLAFVSSTGSEAHMSRGLTVADCTNSAAVNGDLYGGGIIGQINVDGNHYCTTVSGCINNAAVTAKGDAGGIIGRIDCTGKEATGDSIQIIGCQNNGALTGDTSGGIIGNMITNSGNIAIENCTNTGALSAEGQHAGGIIAYWLMGTKPENISFSMTNCENSGDLSTTLSAGGIISYMDAPVLLEGAENVKISLTSCKSTGNITTSTINGAIGGVVGVLGMGGIQTAIDGCSSSGKLSITATTSSEEKDGTAEKVMTVSRIAGGIVGRIGSGLLLTVDNDTADQSNINASDAVIKLSGCTASCTLELADSEETVNIKNYFGGIVGNTCGESDFSILVENCTYTGFDRGLGNQDLPDVGTKN